MSVDSLISIVSTVAEYTVAPIASQIGYVINYKSNVENFKEQVNQLTGARQRVQHSVDEARRNVEEIEQDVDTWLNRVTRITEEAEGFIVEDEDEAKKRCLNGWCPNLKSRYQLSKKAKKKMEAVVNLKGEGEAFVKLKEKGVSYRVPLPAIWSTSIEGYMALESRMPALKEIMEALTSSNLSVIGVYGMGGVGKTTLVEQVARKAREDKLFDQVVMATVKETPDVENIQTTIADKLGLKFDEGSQSGRADRLWRRLQDEKKLLVILDDVSTALVLKEIGIPFGDDHEGCKLLLTSRYQDVLSREMGTQKDFRVEILLEDEAWNLFEKTVGDVVNDAKVRPVAIEVAKRCLGLPVLIVPVAKALRNGSLYDWKDALKKLERFDNEEVMNAKVFSALELSYNHLKDKEVKSLFLLCGQLRHDSILIQDLLKYSLGLGIFKNISNLDEARNRVHKLVNDLKAACLLLEGESPRSVKMHDFVHDFALSIASRDHHVFSVDRTNELKEWPPKDKLEQCTSISFPEPSIHELPEELQCPKVESFFLFSRDPSLKIPENFFKRMKKLIVLDLTTVHLLPLPLSLQYLENLRTLCLDFCVLGDIAALGELKKLEILSLIASNIVQLPTEIGKLTRLLLLDLSRCSKLEVISPGVLSSLYRLEDLYMGENSFVHWEIEESNSRRSNASLTELMNLPNLISLDIHIPDAKILPEEFFSDRLERYHILIGDGLDWSGMNRTSRMLKLKLHISSHMKYGVKMLLKETEDLHLHELKGVENVLFDLDGKGFPLLKHLSVQNSPEVLYIINSKGRFSCSAFPILESLILDKLINLEKICHGQLTVGSFAKLRSIKVESCHKLTYLFSVSLAGGLRQLQEIEVTECEIMEEIVADRREDDANYNAAIDKIEFTLLRSLTLKHLPWLTRFSSISKMPSASQRGQKLLTSDTRSKEIVSEDELTTPTPLFNEKVVFPNLQDLKLFSIDIEKIWDDQLLAMSFHFQNLTRLIVDGCGNLKYLFSTSMVESLVKLQNLEICNCKFMERVIVTEEEGMIKMQFPKLVRLKLKNLPKLRGFYSQNFIEFPTLSTLWVENCPDLKTFISNSICTGIMESKELEEMKPEENLDADQQAFFDDKVVFPNLQNLKLFSTDIEKIWDDQLLAMSFHFQNLTRLIVDGCGSLKYSFSISTVESLVKLQNLEICNCKFMERVIVTEEEGMIKMQFPKLVSLKLKNLPKLRGFCSQNYIKFPALSILWVENCPDLKTFISNSICTGIMESKELEEMKSEENLDADQQAFFDDKVGLPDLKGLAICSMNKVKKIWHDQLASDSFCKLITLNINNCENLVNIFPSYMFERLQRLEVLIVTNSGSLEELFEHQGPHVRKTHAVVAPQLRKLFLRTLPSLKHVWNEDIQEILAFQNLHSIEVIGCQMLEHLFPAFVARGLLQLEVFEITSCSMKEIVAKEKGVEAATSFVFPRVTSMKLWRLPELKCFYHGLHTSEWPMLKKLVVYGCGKVECFASNLSSFQETHGEGQHDILVQQPLFLVEKVAFPYLEELRLERNNIMKEIWHGQFLAEYLSKLKVLELICFPQESVIFPSCFLQGLPNLQKLLVSDAPFKEIFLCEGFTGGEEKHVVTHIRLSELKLSKLPELMYLWKETIQPSPVFQNLETLEVSDCGKLKYLVPSSISFQNLTALIVSKCDRLIHLVTPSTARSLVQLTKMSITECEMMEEIVANKGEETQDEITFSRLKRMELHFLPRLTSFSSGNYTFEFPSLEEVIVRQCPKMKIFSIGNSSAPMLQGIQVAADEQHWEGNLNTTIQWLSTEMDVFRFLEYLNLSEVPEMQEIWHGQDPVRFRHLRSLVVDKCAFLLNAIPSSLLQFLNNLEELDVRSCNLLEEIFGLEGLNADEGYLALLSNLSKFSLSDLPRLRHVWNEGSQRILGLKNLKVLKVHNCSKLRNICAPSLALALVQLEEMEVQNCPMIEKIMTTRVEEAEIDKIVFPRLGSIILESLPNLTSFYSGTSILECPSLKKNFIIDCPNMKTFTITTLREQEPKMVGEGDEERIGKGELDITIALFFNEKAVFPKLKRLKLCSVDVEKIWHDQLPAMSYCIQNLRVLIVKGCGNLRYLFTSCMFKSLVQLKRLEIRECKIMEEIIVTEGSQGGCMNKMLFPKLEGLVLVALPKLTRFCTANVIECLVLKKLTIDDCPELKSFISNSISAYITASSEPEEINLDEKQNTDIIPLFDEKVVLPNLEILLISHMKNLKKIWHNELAPNSFCKLYDFRVDFCGKLLNIFRSNMLRRLERLEILTVSDCGLIEEVFELHDLDGSKTHVVTATPLRELYLANLPNLKHVWNKDPIGISCGLEETVAKESDVEAAISFVFPRATSLELRKLPELKSFYPGTHISEWPLLKKLVVYGCDKVGIFSLRSPRFQETHEESQHMIPIQQPLFLVIKVAFPNLEELRLEWNDIMKEKWHSQFSSEYFHKLKVLELIGFPKEFAIFPSFFLQELPNLEKLVVSNAFSKEIFPCERIYDEEKQSRTTLARLSELKLSDLPELMHLWKEGVQGGPAFENLGTLEVSKCDSLEILVPSSISFQNLTILEVSKCHRLINLVTLSTTRSLVQLSRMIITECELMTEAIANEGSEAKDEIVFNQLKYLGLHCLPSLTSFCSGSYTFEFPSLEEVIVNQCPKLQIFSQGVLSTPKLQRVQLTEEGDKEHWEGNLNSTIQHLFNKMNVIISEED